MFMLSFTEWLQFDFKITQAHRSTLMNPLENFTEVDRTRLDLIMNLGGGKFRSDISHAEEIEQRTRKRKLRAVKYVPPLAHGR